MKHGVPISLLMLAGVGIWVLAPWKSGESSVLVDKVVQDSREKSPAKEPSRSLVDGTSKPGAKAAHVLPNTIGGPSGRVVQFATPPPLRPVVPNVEVGSASAPSGASVGGGGGDSDQAAEIPSAVYAVDDGQAIGVGYPGGMAREISIPVPEGAKVPAVFFDGEDKPVAQQKALDRIAEEFEQNVAEVPSGLTKEEVWEAARAIADERYITLFGYGAFNQYHLQAAKEALREKKVIQAGQGEP